MKERLNSCFVCGESNPVVIEEHHLLPRRYGGPDTESNTVLLCANCHRALERLYDNEFWEFAFQQLKWSGEIDEPVPDISQIKLETEDHLRRKARYDCIVALREMGEPHASIREFLGKCESFEQVSQSYISRLLNAESFEEAYVSD